MQPAAYMTASEYTPQGVALQDRLGAERPPTLGRKFVELLLCIVIFNLAFSQKLGLNLIPFLLGGFLAAAGGICFLVMMVQGERLPMTLWFALALNVGANVSQVLGNGQPPILGEGLNILFLWFCIQMLFCYVVQNSGAQKRILLYSAVLSVAVLVIGGEGVKQGRTERLVASDFGLMANSNSVAYICGFLCVALLFWSLRCIKPARPVLWALAAVLAYMTVQSLSRVGVVILAFGLLMFVISILSARGARVGGLVFLVVAFVAISQLAFLFADSAQMLERRMYGERTNTESRTRMYNLQTIGDLIEATPFGHGPSNSQVSSTGITAHNTFVYIYLSFGAITAWPYLIWMLVLGVRLIRLSRAPDYPVDHRIMLLTLFGMIVGEHITNNQGFLDLSALYGTGLIEKYTQAYGNRSVALRQSAEPSLLHSPEWQAG